MHATWMFVGSLTGVKFRLTAACNARTTAVALNPTAVSEGH